jgi:hypothetical protein
LYIKNEKCLVLSRFVSRKKLRHSPDRLFHRRVPGTRSERREEARRGPLPQPNTPQLENREFYRDGQDEQDKSLNASLILFILSIPVKFLLLELSAHNLASKTRNLGISIKAQRREVRQQKIQRDVTRFFLFFIDIP